MAALFIKVLKKDLFARKKRETTTGKAAFGAVVLSAQKERGATMVETAFGLSLFLFLTLCLFSILWSSYHYVVAQFLATEAVRELQVLSETEAGGVVGAVGRVNRANAIINAIECRNFNPARLNRLCSRNYAMNLGATSVVRVRSFNGTTWANDAGRNGDFVEVRIPVAATVHRIVTGAAINLGGGLQYNQNFAMEGRAIGRNEGVQR